MACISADLTDVFSSASYPGHTLTVSPIGPTGIVSPTPQILPNHTNAHAIADASSHYVIATTLGNDLVNVFALDAATGTLQPNTPPSKGSKAHTMVADSI
jgi:6-phosphogluconolactonase